ncbi:hypothetical protein EW145_g3077 [Phellinidium pouzarii]|uniref:Serine hydroxymethyltransferase n=1 Tax=Phellinidium pouzarii TaxID=167371 RepID=A0A4S4L8E6_9AGAM|nr:hypothetical protein EW145_g3077 [Phellinidium pouzarii]
MSRNCSERTKNVLNTTSGLLQLLDAVSNTTPLQPLKVVCGVASIILNTVQTIEKLKEDYNDLATRAAELVLAVCTECSSDSSLSEDLAWKIDNLLSSLTDILNFLKTYRKLKRFGFFWRMQEIKDNIAIYNKRIQQCYTIFNITSLISIQKTLRSDTINSEAFEGAAQRMNTGLNTIQAITGATQQGVEYGLGTLNDRIDTLVKARQDQDNPFVVTPRQVIPLRQVWTDGSCIYKGELRGEEGKVNVVIKVYRCGDEPANTSEVRKRAQGFHRDVNAWRSLFHPNVHRLMGYTSTERNGPDPKFIVFNDYSYDNIQTYRVIQLDQGDIASVVSIAKLLQGLASGMEFLRTCRKVCKRELQECLKTSNTVISSDGRLIVGHNLLINELQYEPLIDPDSQVPWMKDALWHMVTEFVYGPKEVDYTDWNWTNAMVEGRSASHLRMLQTFIDYTQPSIASIAKQLDTFVNMLDALDQRKGGLTYQSIRKAILEVKEGRVAYCYRPNKLLPVKLLDVGYMDDDGEFVLVDNVRHLIHFELYAHPGRALKSSGDHVEGAADDTGMARHRFFDPTCAQVRTMTFCEGIARTKVGWAFLIDELPKLYYQQYRHAHPGLLIIKFSTTVTRIETDLRYSYLNWVPEPGFEETDLPPAVVEFVEIVNPQHDEPWGSWVIKDMRGISIKDYRFSGGIEFHPPQITFLNLQNKDLYKPLAELDPDVQNIIDKETWRQWSGLELIASENLTSRATMEANGSILTNKYSEGLPSARYYGGNEWIDELEELCRKRALEAFHLDPTKWGVNVQPYSGSTAKYVMFHIGLQRILRAHLTASLSDSFAALTALIQPQDRLMGLGLPDGGHLTHGYYTAKKKITASSIYFQSFPYGLDPASHLIDYTKLAEQARLFKPRLIICGASAYPRDWDYASLRATANEHGAFLMADIAHTSGLVAAQVLADPFEHCDVVTTTTHKTLRGPRAGLIFFRKDLKNAEDLEKRVNESVFPACQGGPHNNTIAGIATALKQACSPTWQAYAKQVISNAQTLATELVNYGHKIQTNGTDNHLVLWDLRPSGVTGSKVEKICDLVGITINKSAQAPGGIRLGTSALTSRNMTEEDHKTVAGLLHRTVQLSLKLQKEAGSKLLKDFVRVAEKSVEVHALRVEVRAFARRWPLPGVNVLNLVRPAGIEEDD